MTQRLAQDPPSYTQNGDAAAQGLGRTGRARARARGRRLLHPGSIAHRERRTTVVHQQDAVARRLAAASRPSRCRSLKSSKDARRSSFLGRIPSDQPHARAAGRRGCRGAELRRALRVRSESRGRPISPAASPVVDAAVDRDAGSRTAPLASLAVDTDGLFVTDARSQLDAALTADRRSVAGLLPRRLSAERQGARGARLLPRALRSA